MALSAPTLQAAIHADLAPALIAATQSTQAIPIALWTEISLQLATVIAAKVVAHITSAGVVQIPILTGTAAVPPGTCATIASTGTIT